VAYKRCISLKKNRQWLRVKGWENVLQANQPHKQEGVVIIISEKADIRLKSVPRDDGHFILIKGTLDQRGISILNIYEPNTVTVLRKKLITISPYIKKNRVYTNKQPTNVL
jgi:exonuclease III